MPQESLSDIISRLKSKGFRATDGDLQELAAHVYITRDQSRGAYLKSLTGRLLVELTGGGYTGNLDVGRQVATLDEVAAHCRKLVVTRILELNNAISPIELNARSNYARQADSALRAYARELDVRELNPEKVTKDKLREAVGKQAPRLSDMKLLPVKDRMQFAVSDFLRTLHGASKAERRAAVEELAKRMETEEDGEDDS